MSKRAYLSGPMTGYAEWNYPAFRHASLVLKNLGWHTNDPSENFGGDPNHPGGRKAYMREDFIKVMSSDCVAFLPGWEKSKGARAEALIAYELELDFYMFTQDLSDIYELPREKVGQILGLEPLPYETVCAKADRLVSSERGSAYGHPLDDFTRTGKMWGAILGIPPVPPELVGLCMVAVKVSREVNHHKKDEDNLVDIAGYSKTVALVHHERKRRENLCLTSQNSDETT